MFLVLRMTIHVMSDELIIAVSWSTLSFVILTNKRFENEFDEFEMNKI